jgi:integrase
VWTAATSGLRFGELTGLTRRHVDLRAPSLRVEQALADIQGQGPTLGPPKSVAAHRVVVIPQSTAELLADHIDEFVEEGDDALIFTSLKGSALLNTYFAPQWRRAVKAAGLDTGVRFHDLRHLAGTTAASAGASLREIMARMGHASAEASLRYLKASERRDAEIAAAIEQRVKRDLSE